MIRRWIAGVVLLIALGGAWWFVMGRAVVLLGFQAKESCSCLFVSHRTEKECRKYVDIGFAKPQLDFDRAAGTSTTLFMGQVRSARFDGAQFGCRLL